MNKITKNFLITILFILLAVVIFMPQNSFARTVQPAAKAAGDFDLNLSSTGELTWSALSGNTGYEIWIFTWEENVYIV